MIFEAQREQNICPENDECPLHLAGETHTAYATVMLPSPSREQAFAIITLLAILVVHPIVLR